jgi:hypothetical protein
VCNIAQTAIFRLRNTNSVGTQRLSVFDTMIGGVMTSSILVLSASLIVVALLAIYVPTVYIRKTNKMIHLLEQIAANTRR